MNIYNRTDKLIYNKTEIRNTSRLFARQFLGKEKSIFHPEDKEMVTGIELLTDFCFALWEDVENESYVEVVKNLHEMDIWEDEFQRRTFLLTAIGITNDNAKRQRITIRNLISQSSSIKLEEFYDYYFDTLKKRRSLIGNRTPKEVNQTWEEDIKKLKSHRYITLYRGFNTRADEEIRFSNDKNNSDYYKQKEGMGFCYTLDKYFAYGFASSYQVRLIRRKQKLSYDTHYREFPKIAEAFPDVGRMTIGRFVVHTDHIFGYTNSRDEREVIVDYRKVKLIDYKFISDIKLNAKEYELIPELMQEKYNLFRKRIQKLGNKSWINTHYINDYRVTKKIEELF